MAEIINEEWRTINGYLNYQVSNIGRVRNVATKQILKGRECHKGYLRVALYENRVCKNHAVHRLAAAEFIENPHNLPMVDHIDGNRKNNAINNLRFCTNSQNQMNSVKKPHTSSQFKGVSLHTSTNLWIASVTKQGKRYHLGLFTDEIEAAKAYNKKAIELFGEFANLNVIPDDVENELINKIKNIINKLENAEQPDFSTDDTLCKKLKNIINSINYILKMT